MEKINKPIRWLTEMTNKIVQLLDSTRKKRAIITNTKHLIPLEPTDFMKIIRECQEWLYDYKFDNLGKMYKFLERNTKEETMLLALYLQQTLNIQNRTIKYTPSVDRFPSKFQQTFKMEITLILYRFFAKPEFYKDSIPKYSKSYQKRRQQTKVPLEPR